MILYLICAHECDEHMLILIFEHGLFWLILPDKNYIDKVEYSNLLLTSCSEWNLDMQSCWKLNLALLNVIKLKALLTEWVVDVKISSSQEIIQFGNFSQCRDVIQNQVLYGI